MPFRTQKRLFGGLEASSGAFDSKGATVKVCVISPAVNCSILMLLLTVEEIMISFNDRGFSSGHKEHRTFSTRIDQRQDI